LEDLRTESKESAWDPKRPKSQVSQRGSAGELRGRIQSDPRDRLQRLQREDFREKHSRDSRGKTSERQTSERDFGETSEEQLTEDKRTDMEDLVRASK
jgi:hypothetical protein